MSKFYKNFIHVTNIKLNGNKDQKILIDQWFNNIAVVMIRSRQFINILHMLEWKKIRREVEA